MIHFSNRHPEAHPSIPSMNPSLPPTPLINSLLHLHIAIIPPLLSNKQLLPPITEPLLSLKSPQRNTFQSRKIPLQNRIPESGPHSRRVQLTSRLTAPIRPITRKQSHRGREHACNGMVILRKRPDNFIIAVFADTQFWQSGDIMPRTHRRSISSTISKNNLAPCVGEEFACVRTTGWI